MLRRLFPDPRILWILPLIALMRLHSYSEPIERDIAIYSVIGEGLLQGRPLYADLWDIKPPGIYLLYALGQALTPSWRSAVYLLNVSAAFLTAVGIARLLGRTALHHGSWLALWAGLCWALVSMSPGLQANQPNTEVFMNAALAWFLVYFLPVDELPWNRVWCAAGILAAATLLKPYVVITAFHVGLALLIAPPGKSWDARSQMWRRLFALAIPSAGLWIATLIYFVAVDRWGPFVDTIFGFGGRYAGDSVENFFSSLAVEQLAPSYLHFLTPLFVLTVAGVLAALRRGETRRLGLVMAALVFSTQAQVAMPGKFFPHYYQLWLPVLVLGAAWGLSLWPQRRVVLALAAVTLAGLAWTSINDFRRSPEDWSRQKYGEEFVIDKRAGETIRTLLEPGESFYQWGDQPSLYFEAERVPPSGVLLTLVLYDRVMGPVLRQRIVDDLNLRPPDLMVLSAKAPPPDQQDRELAVFLREHYVAAESLPRIEGFQLLARKQSLLLTRLGQNSNR